jgi:Flp pilus assembly protein TadG
VNLMRILRQRARESSGQATILTVLALFMFIPLGAAVFDVGMLLNDRRDAQNDVDRAALAAVLDLTLDVNDSGWPEAEVTARQWLIRNDVDPDTEATIAPAFASDCFPNLAPSLVSLYAGMPVGVTVTVQRETQSFLAGAMGLDLSTGATATACMGVPAGYFGIFPLVVSAEGLEGTCFDANRKPIPGADCRVRLDETSEGIVGELTVEYPAEGELADCTKSGSGANDLENNLIHGIQGWCMAGDQVNAKPGLNINKTFDGIKGRLAQEGSCDASYAASGESSSALAEAWSALDTYLANYPGYDSYTGLPMSDNRGAIPAVGNGIDDFYQIWTYPGPESPASGLVSRPCPGYDGSENSPRNIVLIVVPDMLDTSATSGKKYTILDFSRMYLEGCTRTSNQGVSEFRRDCGWNSLGSGTLTIHARYIEQIGGGSQAKLGLTELLLGDRETFLAR